MAYAAFAAALAGAGAIAQGRPGDAELLCAVEKLKGDEFFKKCAADLGKPAAKPKPVAAPPPSAAVGAREIDCAIEKLKGQAQYDRCLAGTKGAAPSAAAPGLFEHQPDPLAKTVGTAANLPLWKPISTRIPPRSEQPQYSPVELFKRLAPSVYIVIAQAPLEPRPAEDQRRQGSAVAISADIALTNCHVVAGYAELFISRDNRLWPIVVLAADTLSDRCIVRSSDYRLEPVQSVRPSPALAVGEKVYTIGSPRGLDRTLGEGLVSRVRTNGERHIVQTSAPISGGSSGGGLFDSFGNLIGITTSKAKDSENINFAIAAEEFWR